MKIIGERAKDYAHKHVSYKAFEHEAVSIDGWDAFLREHRDAMEE